MMPQYFDIVDYMIRYDEGALSWEEYINFMQYLVDTGMAWQLQGRIGRDAANLLEQGFIEPRHDD